MQNIFLIEDPFSVNYKDDWDTPETNNTSNTKLNIMLEDVDDEEGFLADLDARIEAQAKDKIDTKIEILGTTV